MVSGEILIKTAVVSLVHELFVSLSEVHFFAHHHCGRHFVSKFDDDVSSSLESFKCLSFFLCEVVSPMSDVLSLTLNVPNCLNVCLQGCVTITMGCRFAFLFESMGLGRFIFLCHLWVIKEFVSPVSDVLSLTLNVPNCLNVCLQGCVTITMGCRFAFLFESMGLGRFISGSKKNSCNRSLRSK